MVARVYVCDRRGADQAHAFDALGAHQRRQVEADEHGANVIAFRTATGGPAQRH